LGAVLIDGCEPALLGRGEDRGADGFGQVIADRVADPVLARERQQLVRGAGGIGPQQQLDPLDVLGGDLGEGVLGDGDLIGRGVGPPRARLSVLLCVKSGLVS
jgi:hypothetical protein